MEISPTDENETVTGTDVTTPAPALTIKVVVTGTMNENVEYVDGMTINQVLESAGVNPDSLEQGTIAVDGKVVVRREDLNEKITKEQQIVSVAPNAPNGS